MGRLTAAVLLAAFVFGIATLWMDEAWPFAVFEAVILLTAGAWFAAGISGALLYANAWLALPAAAAALGAVQVALSRSEYAWQTRQAVIEWITFACAALLAFQIARDPRMRATGLRVFVLSGGALALVSTLQNYTAPGRVFWLFDSGYDGNVFGPFVYHTKLANFAELAIPAAAWLALKERKRAAVYAGSAVALAGAVVASGSRGGIVVLTAEFLTIGALWSRQRRTARPILLFAASLLAGVAVCGWTLAGERIGGGMTHDLRLSLAASTAGMLGRWWLTGSGLGTWSTVYPAYARFDLHQFINQAHNDWLQWLSEGGIAMPAIVGAMLAGIVRAARREWWTLGFLFVWLHGAFDYPMRQTPAFAAMQIAFWGAAMALLPANLFPAPQPRRLDDVRALSGRTPR